MIKKFEHWGTGINNDFDGSYLPSNNDNYRYIGYNKLDFEDIINECVELPKSDIFKFISIKTLTGMFPHYNNEENIIKDWSTKLYQYKNYIIFVKSGYYYTFIKKYTRK